jgi:hypothetical protein
MTDDKVYRRFCSKGTFIPTLGREKEGNKDETYSWGERMQR